MQVKYNICIYFCHLFGFSNHWKITLIFYFFLLPYRFILSPMSQSELYIIYSCFAIFSWLFFDIYLDAHLSRNHQLLRSSRTHCTAGVVMSPSNTLLMIDIKQWLYIRILFYICLCIDFRRGCAKKITQKQNFITHIKQCSYLAVSYPAKFQNYSARNLYYKVCDYNKQVRKV